MSKLLDLGNKVALITGAGQGVGRQIALHFAAHNAAGIVVNDYFLDPGYQISAFHSIQINPGESPQELHYGNTSTSSAASC